MKECVPGDIDELISSLLSSDVPDAAIVSSLQARLFLAKDLQRQALRATFVRAALRAERLQRASAAEVLVKLSGDTHGGGSRFLEGRAAAVTAVASSPMGFTLHQALEETSCDQRVLDLLSATELLAAGPEFERKYRYLGVSEDGTALNVRVAPSGWRVARAFHTLARNEPERLARISFESRTLPAPLGSANLPGLAVVHAIVTTRDRTLLLARRSMETSYAPGHWSSSFEEQVTEGSEGGPESAVEAVQRGMLEEFGPRVAWSDVKILGAILELDSLNLAVVAHLACGLSSTEIRELWLAEPRPSHHHEATEIEFAPLRDPRDFEGLKGILADRPPHPTSMLRLRMFAAHARHHGTV